MRPKIEWVIEGTKQFRKDIDAIVQRLRRDSELDKSCSGPGGLAEPIGYRQSRERDLALTKLQEAMMWLGMDLKAIAEENPGYLSNPYPSSKDPSNSTIEPTSEGLKF